MANEIKTLTKDVWTKVPTNVTNLGTVYIVNQDIEPSDYLVTFVNTGDAAPAVDFAGGVKVEFGFSPAQTGRQISAVKVRCPYRFRNNRQILGSAHDFQIVQLQQKRSE